MPSLSTSPLVCETLAVARSGQTLEPTLLARLCLEVPMQAVERLGPQARWDWLAAGLGAKHPQAFIEALRACTALGRLLPEVAALFGVPQLSDASTPVDIGAHQLRVLAQAARLKAPLPVRVAALLHEIGKGTTPREIWPSHHKHEARGLEMLAALRQRIALPEAVAELAALVIADADRVHRASERRAGPLAALLTQWEIDRRPERFEALLQVCTCDYAAYEGHHAETYTKAALLRRARDAWIAVDASALDADAALAARAQAIARVLGSLRWGA